VKKKSTNREDTRSFQDSPLSKEDLALWNRFKRNIEPLPKKVRGPALDIDRKPNFSENDQPSSENSVADKSRHKNLKQNLKPSQLDRKRIRQIRSGRMALQARLDLHGMRQDQAYNSLRNFLQRCQSDGLKTVLVITGKGRTDSDLERDFIDDRDRGVLRRVVPEWLAQPEFSELILGHSVAGESHGGSGALYIKIRRTK